jgi:hypothetical protein
MTFSSQTFSIDYFVKRRVDYKGLLTQASSSESLRALGRSFGVSCGSIQNRLDRLSRQALALHARLRVLADPRESVCADGFVHFEVSRYFPSETVISITSNSRFILDLSHATRRRSGAMTSYQRARAEKLFTTFEFERGAVTRGFCDILDSLARERPPARMRPLVLVTDEKPEYDYAFGRHRLFREQDEDRRTVRIKVNSGMPRTCSNPLFASNYLDRELRKDLAGCRRDAFCFSRNVSNAMARLSCYIVEHNYRMWRIMRAISSSTTS